MVAPLQQLCSSEMVKEKAAPASGESPWSTPSPPFLRRRILFHPAFATPSSSSFASPPLRPINSPSSPLPSPCLPTSKQDSLPPPSAHQPQELLPSMPIRRIGAGLENLGNTCFLNSVLQCLSYTPPLIAYLQSGQHKISCRISGFCALCALESHVKHALAVPGGVVSPTNFVKNLRSICRSFCVGRQEDAHEYMRYLIESLQKCSLPVASRSDQSNKMQNLIYQIFGGRLRSQIKCMYCSFCSNTYDPFLDLSLEIVRAESLQKALTRFTAAEELDGDNKYWCSKCKMKVKALKQFMVDKAPEILTIQFKRFSAFGGFGGKIDKKIQFDRTLDMRPFMSNKDDAPLSYSLYAVLVHAGSSTHSGHYYCFVRTATEMWHVLDDRRVSQVSEKAVLEQKAYILFYMRLPFSHSASRTQTDLCEPPSKQDAHEDFMEHRENSSKLAKKAKLHSQYMSTSPYLNGLSIESFKEARSNGKMHEVTQLKSESENATVGKSKESSSNGHVNVVIQSNTQSSGSLDYSKEVGSGNHIQAAVSQWRTQLENGCIDQTKGNGSVHIHEDRTQPNNGCTPVKSTGKNTPNEKPLRPIKEAYSVSRKLYGIAVPSWDMDEGIADNRVVDTLVNGETRQCGHVLDDWDEEYDRGKRKKVRKRSNQIESKNMNGRNPFQSFASTELHRVNCKERKNKAEQVDHSRSTNVENRDVRDDHYHRKSKKLRHRSAKLQKRKTFHILAFRGLHHAINGKKRLKRRQRN